MDRTHHQAWLSQLAEEDRRRRALAEPELARKEALLRAAETGLASAKAAVAYTQEALDEARREAATLDDRGDDDAG